jgi:hypothetical protein
MNKRGASNSSSSPSSSSSSSSSEDDGKKKKNEVIQLRDVQILRALFIKLEGAILSLRLNPRDKDHYTDYLVRKPKELFTLFQTAMLTPETFPVFNQFVQAYVSSLAEVASTISSPADDNSIPSEGSQGHSNSGSSLYTSSAPSTMFASNTGQSNEDYLRMLDGGMDKMQILR